MTKTWFSLTCATCGWRHLPSKFIRNIDPVNFPAQLVSGGGRGSGFHVMDRVPWSRIRILQSDPLAWRGLSCEYLRLSAAYDHFFAELGFLSPRMAEIISGLNGEVFRLRALCRELQDRLGRLHLATRPGESHGGYSTIFAEIATRNERERKSRLDILDR